MSKAVVQKWCIKVNTKSDAQKRSIKVTSTICQKCIPSIPLYNKYCSWCLNHSDWFCVHMPVSHMNQPFLCRLPVKILTIFRSCKTRYHLKDLRLCFCQNVLEGRGVLLLCNIVFYYCTVKVTKGRMRTKWELGAVGKICEINCVNERQEQEEDQQICGGGIRTKKHDGPSSRKISY